MVLSDLKGGSSAALFYFDDSSLLTPEK